MIDSSLTASLLAYGPLGVFAILLAIGWLIPRPAHDKIVSKLEAEIATLREALDHERTAGNEMRSAGSVTNKLIGALVALSVHENPPRAGPQRRGLHLDADDLGLGSS